MIYFTTVDKGEKYERSKFHLVSRRIKKADIFISNNVGGVDSVLGNENCIASGENDSFAMHGEGELARGDSVLLIDDVCVIREHGAGREGVGYHRESLLLQLFFQFSLGEYTVDIHVPVSDFQVTHLDG